MQTQRPARTSTDRSKSVRNNPSIVLWRPDIVLASGAILTSLSGGRETASDASAHDARPVRERVSPVTPSRLSTVLGELLAGPAVHIASTERAWR